MLNRYRDVMAAAGLGVVRRMGFSVPDRLSIVSWDDSSGRPGPPAGAAIGFRVRSGVRDSIHYIGAVR
jgi:hypothetical protein